MYNNKMMPTSGDRIIGRPGFGFGRPGFGFGVPFLLGAAFGSNFYRPYYPPYPYYPYPYPYPYY